MNLELTKTSWFDANVYSVIIDESICDEINILVQKEYHTWSGNLKNVKALTSGWDGLRYPIIKNLSDFIAEKILPVIQKEQGWEISNNMKWYNQESWINYYQKGHKTDIHYHSPADYCGVLISKPSANNCLYFRNPIDVQGFLRFFEKKRIELINEKKGLLILFPSWLYHGVEELKDDRISVVFNFELSSK